MSDTATEAVVETSPDPSTNTDPWEAHQDDAFTDIPDTWEQDEEMRARRDGRAPETEAAADGDKPDDTKPDTTVTAESDKPVIDSATPESTPATATELPADVQEQVKAFTELDRAMKEDPSAVAAAILDGMDARQKAAFVKDVLGDMIQAKYTPFNADEYDASETTTMEQALKERWKDIDAIPHAIAEGRKIADNLSALADHVYTSLPETLNPQIAYANVIAEINAVKIDALCQALGIDLPDPNFEALEKVLSEKGIKYRDGVRKVVNYGTAVETHKQKGKTRPTTPGNESKAKTDGPPADMTDPVALAKYYGTIGRR